jgi:hypothetical protein
MLVGKVGSSVNVFIRRLAGDARPACVELTFTRHVEKEATVAHGGAVVAATRTPAADKKSGGGGSSGGLKLSDMRLLQSQVLGQLGVRKTTGYTGQQNFLKRRHGLGK